MTGAQNIENIISEFVLKTFPLARQNGMARDKKWLQTGVIDSLGILDLVHFLENEFSVQITDEELLPENFESLEAVSFFVRQKLGS